PVADTLSAQVECSPNRFWGPRLTGVRSKAHAVVGGPGVGVAEEFGRGFQFVASDADAGDFAVVITNGELEDFLRGFSAELADGVENPNQRDAEVARAAGAAAIQAFEDGGEILLAPQADSDRDIDFGVQNVLFFQPLHQAVADEFVVFGCAQV